MASFVPTKQFLGAPSSSDIGSSRLGSLQLPSKLSSSNFHVPSRPSHPKRLEIQAAGSTFGNYFRVTTFGESHGGGVGCIIDGCPPRLPLSESDMQVELDRRRPGQSRITTPRKETDTCKISSGTADGLTTGSPIKVEVPNTDQRGNDYSEMSLAYRPSHADATYDFKYGVRSVQGGGRSSARETIGRVAAGAVAKKILKLYSGAEVLAYVSQVHQVVLPEDLIDHQNVTLEQIESNIVRCPDPEYAEKMIAAIDAVRVRGDSVGGVVTCIVRNLPRGLGTPVFDKLEAELAKACMSLPATKGFEFGSGFAGTFMTGSEHNDEFYMDEHGRIRTRTNRSGGIQGGISNGEVINMRIGFKPTSTISRKQQTVTRDKHETELIARGRHDPCVVPRGPFKNFYGVWVLNKSFDYQQRQRRREWAPNSWKISAIKGGKECSEVTQRIYKKKGTVAGAVALIIGTSIGSGILALPQKTSPAGIIPSSIAMTICWAFLLIEALVLVEINVGLLKKNKVKFEDGELEIISIRTMAEETLGEWGGALATITYVFLGYTSMIAYISKSGEILCHLINLPESVLGFFFTSLFTILISVGGTKATDQVNQWLTAVMIGLLVAIEVLTILYGGWSGDEVSSDWGKVPSTIPVLIFSLVYHDLAPVLCAYLEGDLKRIRASVLIGGLVPLLALLVWDAIAFGLSSQVDQVVDPVELLLRVKWSGVSYMVQAFSLLAVGTSLIGTLLSFSEFLKEQLNNLNLQSRVSTRLDLQRSTSQIRLRKWWIRNNLGFTATAIAIAPPLLLSTAIPDAFSAATDIAGGYCMTMLYGILPPAMAWAMHNSKGKDSEPKISIARPALVTVGIVACGIVAVQILQDLSMLHS